MSLKQRLGWILPNSRKMEAKPRMTLFKALILSRQGYYCLFPSTPEVGETAELENVQRTSTGCNSCQKSNPLGTTEIRLYVLYHRRDRCIMIYAWKILEGLAPNIHPEIIPYWRDLHGRRRKKERVFKKTSASCIWFCNP